MEQQMALFEVTTPQQQAAVRLHLEVMQAAQSHISSALELGRRLKQMRDTGGYRELGFESLEEYARVAVKMGQRQAYNYIRIAEKVPQRLVEENAEAGVTKLALLAQLGPQDQEAVAGEGQLAGITVAELQRLIEEKKGLAEQLTMLQDLQQMGGGPVAEAAGVEVDLEAVRREAAEQARAEAEARQEQAVAEAVEAARREAWEEAKAQAAGMQEQAVAAARSEAAGMQAAAHSEAETLKKKLSDAERRAREEREKAEAEKQKAVEAARREAYEQGRTSAGQAAAQAEAQRREADARAEALQKRLDLAGDRETERFLALFEQLQETYKKAVGVLDGMAAAGRAEQADKLRGALGRAMEAMIRT